ncbi:MAG: MGMT family protein [Candidatus Bathyarchaeia archaeon]
MDSNQPRFDPSKSRFLKAFCKKTADAWFCTLFDNEGFMYLSTLSLKDRFEAIERALTTLGSGTVEMCTEPPDTVVDVFNSVEALLQGNPLTIEAAINYGRFSPFTRKVLSQVAKVPPGFVTTYKLAARGVGEPKAARAVGNAMARNPLILLVPCHRVVKTDLTLGEYGLGRDLKRSLLRREGVRIQSDSVGREVIDRNCVYRFA